jgi:O-antigen/teichoic acid export membrane protein
MGSLFIDAAKLASGTAIAQVMLGLLTPILSRLYSPETFGVASLFFSITSIGGGIVCLRYELAIMLPEEDDEAATLLAASIGIAAVISILLTPFILSTREEFSVLINASELASFLHLVPLMIFVTGLYSAVRYWGARKRYFNSLSLGKIVDSSFNGTVKLFEGLIGKATASGLIWGPIVGKLVFSVMFGVKMWCSDRHTIIESIDMQKVREMLYRYRKFPIHTSSATILNSVSWQMPVLLLSSFFSPIAVGYYGFANRILHLPMNLVGTAIANAFFPRAAESYTVDKLSSLVENAFQILVGFSLFPLLALSLTGEDLFAVSFGSKWAESGIYVQILSPWMFFWFISSPLSNLYFVLERQEGLLRLNIAIFVTRLISIIIGGYFDSIYLALSLFSLSGILTYGYLSISIILESGVDLVSIVNEISKNLIRFVPLGVILTFMKLIDVNSTLVTVVVFVSCLVYFIYMLMKLNIVQSGSKNTV